MLSKSTLKYLKSLQLKKYRKEEQSFVVEGAKSVLELLRSDFEIEFIAASESFRRVHEAELLRRKTEVTEAGDAELAAAGSFQSNDAAIAVARMKPNAAPPHDADGYILALDDVRDPGNFGTILRTADWFGITRVVASEESADFYNAKTISASMGSFTRVKVFYGALADFLRASKLRKYGAFLGGTDVHATAFAESGIIVIGNESTGISHEVASLIDERITIPKYGKAESLNAAMSAAIILDNLKRS